MKNFVDLFLKVDSTTKTKEKIEALVQYFELASHEDALWCIALFTHKRPKRTVSTTLLRQWAAEEAQIPLWLFEDSYHIVGDLAETITLVLDPSSGKNHKSLSEWILWLKSLKDKEEEEKKSSILNAWKELSKDERFLFNKIITGGFRIGISKKTVINALSKYLNKSPEVIAHKLMGNWTPETTSFDNLLVHDTGDENLSKPYPFYLAYPLDVEIESLGDQSEWMFEWKWDGIRGQLIKREGQVFIWSRGEELVNEAFPEFGELSESIIDGFVIDGEILVYQDDRPANFQSLQKRLGRKKVSKKMQEAYPVVMMAYDIMEVEGKDIRHLKQVERRQILESLVKQVNRPDLLKISEIIQTKNWIELKEQRERSRSLGVEGFMIKHKNGQYKTGRKKGEWFKWKVDPYTIDGVMIYAQRGHGRRANLFSDFTFAVWNEGKLVPFAKAYSGLTDVEFKEISQIVKKTTIERFGPVHSIEANQVFEIAFEGISQSTRHKSGVALRFPRIVRWRKDKRASEANTLEDLKKII